MVQAGVPIPAAHLLSDFYNKTRDAYYRALDRTSRPPYPVDQFISMPSAASSMSCASSCKSFGVSR